MAGFHSADSEECHPAPLRMADSSRPGWVERVLRVGLGALFLWSAGLKLRDVHAFESTIGRFGIVFDALVPATACSLVMLELLTGAGLVLGLRCASWAASGLLLLFLGVLGYGLFLGLDIECGCLGPGERTNLSQAFLRDLALLGVCCLLAWKRARRKAGSFSPEP
jgi:hypothetical protein